MKPKPLPAKRRAANDKDPLVVAARIYARTHHNHRTTRYADAVAEVMTYATEEADCAAFVMGAVWQRRQTKKSPTPARSARRSRG